MPNGLSSIVIFALGYPYAPVIYLKGEHKMYKFYDEVEQCIGYKFKRRALLKQAFTRKSYTQETRDGDNNEVLEFIGDKALDLAVVRAMSDYFGRVNDRDEYSCDLNEGNLTKFKARLIESKMLAHRIDELGFAKYLIMGKGDRKKGVQDDSHVKEDLFEAIVGAVAIDSDWDIDEIQDVVDLMLNLDYYLENGFEDNDDYVSLVQQWFQKKYGQLPIYHFEDSDLYKINCLVSGGLVYDRNDTIENRDSEGPITGILRIESNTFVGFGYSKSQARMAAAERAYEYLEENGLLFTFADEIGELTLETAISKLNELSQKGYFSKPEYFFSEDYDGNGNPIWECECRIAEYKYYYSDTSKTKQAAKSGAAYKMLMSIKYADGSDNKRLRGDA